VPIKTNPTQEKDWETVRKATMCKRIIDFSSGVSDSQQVALFVNIF
jgi:hypothetical protein